MDEPRGQSDPDTSELDFIILAAVDNSKLASLVVEIAARAARRMWSSSALHLLHVWRTSRFDRPTSAGFTREELVREAQEFLAYQVKVARRQATVPVAGHFAEGDPAYQIVQMARSLNADLVVVGTGDHGGLERFLVGSVAEKVSRHAPCPVLIVRQKQRPYIRVASHDSPGDDDEP
jgi:nucleotide-binding universal stress UspA family protein